MMNFTADFGILGLPFPGSGNYSGGESESDNLFFFFKSATNGLLGQFILLLIAWYIFDFFQAVSAKRPPGPPRIPILGSIPHVVPGALTCPDGVNRFNIPPYVLLHNLSKRYGPIFNYKFGVQNTIIVNDLEIAKDIFSRDEFSYRYLGTWLMELRRNGKWGLLLNNGESYKKCHRFTVKTLKEFGFGKAQSMEDAIKEELGFFLENFKLSLRATKDKPENVVNVKQLFSMTVLNILWTMTAGVRFCYNDEKLKTLINYVEQIMTTIDVGGKFIMAFPWLRHIAPELCGHAEHIRLNSRIHEFIRTLLQERREEGTFKENPRDFIDCFLQKMDQETHEEPDPDKRFFTEDQFIITVTDFFMAGGEIDLTLFTETTANTMEFALLFMILNPHVQKKVHEEIDQVIGSNRSVCAEDRLNLPYVEATCLEIQRHCNVIPMIPRYARKNTTIGPHKVFKGDTVVVNLYSCHLSSKSKFEDPDVFRPERFLVEQGDGKFKVSQAGTALTFGAGRRQCIGELYAKTVFFIYFASLMQLYSFERAPSEFPQPSMKPMRGATLAPCTFYAKLTPRF